MENRVIDEVHIREYLLGRLEGDPEFVEQIDEQILTNPQFSIIVDVVEDEIIEEYIEGSLNADDARAVERHFLRLGAAHRHGRQEHGQQTGQDRGDFHVGVGDFLLRICRLRPGTTGFIQHGYGIHRKAARFALA